MDVDVIPLPEPRRKSNSNFIESSDSTPTRNKIVHQAEVHRPSKLSSANNLPSSSSDDNENSTNKYDFFKKRRKISKKSSGQSGKSTPKRIGSGNKFPKKGNATDTLSENSSDDCASFTIPKYRAPSGNLTETLSESSDNDVQQTPPVPAPRSRPNSGKRENENITKHNSSEDDHENDENINNEDRADEKNLNEMSDKTPTPLPRQMSIDNLAEENFTTKPEVSKEVIQKKNETVLPKVKEDLKYHITDDQQMVCVTVHGCDKIKEKDLNKKIYVKIYVVDRISGKLKNDFSPLITSKPCNFPIQKSIIPQWEEDLIIKLPITTVANLDTILFFEILMEDNKEKCKKEKLISWAFLKLIGANGADNLKKLLRLQMFKPGKKLPKKLSNDTLRVFYWWSKGRYSTYKCTLYVTINPIPEKEIFQETRIETEPNDNTNNYTEDINENEIIKTTENSLPVVTWSRLSWQLCKLPNKINSTLDGGQEGALVMRFSNSGLFLATPTNGITIYMIDGQIYRRLQGHLGLIYGLEWSPDDTFIISASADSTCCVWDVVNHFQQPIQILPHPSYVYCCSWITNNIIVTGCFDEQVRIWKTQDSSRTDIPIQYLSWHKSRINAIAVFETSKLITGDCDGKIAIWKIENNGEFISFHQHLRIREVDGKIINNLIINSKGTRLLIHTRDNVLRMFDLESNSIIQWYRDALNEKMQTSCVMCACEKRIWLFAEDGLINVWETDTGRRIATYLTEDKSLTGGALATHPYDHIMAYLPKSNYSSLIITEYNREYDGKELNLTFLNWQGDAIIKKSISRLNLTSCLNNKMSQSPNSKVSSKTSSRASSAQSFKKANNSSGLLNSLLSSKKKLFNSKYSSQFKQKDNGETNLAFVSEFNNTSEDAISSASNCSTFKSSTKTTNNINDTPRDSRLADIINKMDKIIMSASPRNHDG